jgi:hypothetical protein
MADVDKKAVSVRSNMDRLRALRQAREAEEAITLASNPPVPKKKRKAAVKR